MSRVARVPFDEVLERVRRAAHRPGEYAGQESFMRVSEIRELAARAGIGPGVSVLDLCCGVAGPGRLLAAELGCDYLGVDASPDAIDLARRRAAGLRCRFQVCRVPPLPAGRFDVVLLLETMLAFEDKGALLLEVAAALPPGGRFAFTVEEGLPLSSGERDRMPDADTVWPVPLPWLLSRLDRAGLSVAHLEDRTASHHEVAVALTEAMSADRAAVAAGLGERVVGDLLASHRLWSEWLGSQRVRKLAVVAEKVAPDGEPVAPRSRTPG